MNDYRFTDELGNRFEIAKELTRKNNFSYWLIVNGGVCGTSECSSFEHGSSFDGSPEISEPHDPIVDSLACVTGIYRVTRLSVNVVQAYRRNNELSGGVTLECD